MSPVMFLKMVSQFWDVKLLRRHGFLEFLNILTCHIGILAYRISSRVLVNRGQSGLKEQVVRLNRQKSWK